MAVATSAIKYVFKKFEIYHRNTENLFVDFMYLFGKCSQNCAILRGILTTFRSTYRHRDIFHCFMFFFFYCLEFFSTIYLYAYIS